jgi:hypothetical protein
MTPYSISSSYIAYQKFSLSITEMLSSNCSYVFTEIYNTIYYDVEGGKQNLNNALCKILCFSEGAS